MGNGGYNVGRDSKTTLIYEDGIFTPGPVLPIGKHGHCQVTIDATHVVAGRKLAWDRTRSHSSKWPAWWCLTVVELDLGRRANGRNGREKTLDDSLLDDGRDGVHTPDQATRRAKEKESSSQSKYLRSTVILFV